MSAPSELVRFALAVLEQFHGDGERGDIGGDWIQEKAVECGVMTQELRTTPCSDACVCAEFYGSGEEARCFPIRDDVFRLMRMKPHELSAALAAAREEERALVVAIVDEAETLESGRYETWRDEYSQGRMDALSDLRLALTATARGTGEE